MLLYSKFEPYLFSRGRLSVAQMGKGQSVEPIMICFFCLKHFYCYGINFKNTREVGVLGGGGEFSNNK